jgi:hypothetical protein
MYQLTAAARDDVQLLRAAQRFGYLVTPWKSCYPSAWLAATISPLS